MTDNKVKSRLVCQSEDMLPILETLDQAGFHALEVWGGATFDSCIRFLNEDPWERLRQIRAAVKDTKNCKCYYVDKTY